MGDIYSLIILTVLMGTGWGLIALCARLSR